MAAIRIRLTRWASTFVFSGKAGMKNPSSISGFAKLAGWLNALGRDVGIVVRPSPGTRLQGRLRVI
jgi:hypothetical protein